MNPLGAVGINQAAKLTGKNKAVIHRDAESKKLHFSTNEKGHRVFQLADLIACYGEFKPITSDETESDHLKSPKETSVTSDLTFVLQAKEQVIDTLMAQIEDLKRERDRWHKAFEETKALPAPQRAVKPGFFARLLGRAA